MIKFPFEVLKLGGLYEASMLENYMATEYANYILQFTRDLGEPGEKWDKMCPIQHFSYFEGELHCLQRVF